MKYEIKGDSFPVLICTLNTGETMISESGAMSWMSPGINMDTSTGGGLLKGIGRALSGESIFLNYFTANSDNQQIAFCSSFAGSIIPYEISPGKELIAQKRAFISGTPGVDINIHFQKKFSAGFFGGEGFILQRFSGNGIVFLEIDGSIMEYDLAPGQSLLIDQGNLAAMEQSVSFDIETIKGLKNVFFGGEGMFIGRLTGPGKVWLQTMPVSKLANMILSHMPSK